MKNLYFIDFENLQNFSYEKINPVHDMVVIFVGHNQSKINFEIINKTQKLGTSVEWIKMGGSGRNALDFHIAYYLGYFIASQEEKNTKCNIFVASGDGDYDVLIKHIQDQGHHCERIVKRAMDSIPQCKSQLAQSNQLTEDINNKLHHQISIEEPISNQAVNSKELSNIEICESLIETLGKIEKLKRPRTVKTLQNHITAHYKKKKKDLAPESIINLLKANKHITVSDLRISYRF